MGNTRNFFVLYVIIQNVINTIEHVLSTWQAYWLKLFQTMPHLTRKRELTRLAHVYSGNGHLGVLVTGSGLARFAVLRSMPTTDVCNTSFWGLPP